MKQQYKAKCKTKRRENTPSVWENGQKDERPIEKFAEFSWQKVLYMDYIHTLKRKQKRKRLDTIDYDYNIYITNW